MFNVKDVTDVTDTTSAAGTTDVQSYNHKSSAETEIRYYFVNFQRM